jgi:autotransporter passenger strand-loop-strand repeat protein
MAKNLTDRRRTGGAAVGCGLSDCKSIVCSAPSGCKAWPFGPPPLAAPAAQASPGPDRRHAGRGGVQYDVGTASGTMLSGGTEVVYGSAAATTVASGGLQYVVAGGTAIGTTVSSGGIQYDAGTVSGTTLSGGTEIVDGTATSVTVASGGIQNVDAGGTAIGTTVSSGGILADAGMVSSIALSGGLELVYGSDTSATVASGGLQYVIAGGTAASATVSGGGTQVVYGTAAATTVASGGVEVVYGIAARGMGPSITVHQTADMPPHQVCAAVGQEPPLAQADRDRRLTSRQPEGVDCFILKTSAALQFCGFAPHCQR